MYKYYDVMRVIICGIVLFVDLWNRFISLTIQNFYSGEMNIKVNLPLNSQLAISLVCIILVSSCQLPVSDKATTIINQSIDAHGGMEKWQSLDKISYRKEITLYSKEKTIRKYIEQQHDYLISSHLEGSYSYYDSLKHEVIFNGKTAYKKVGEIQNAPDDSAFNSFNSAYYVLNMPWKLLDKGAHSIYEGLDTLFSGQIVESIKVEYTSGTSKDTWWYYFDPVTLRVVACLVHHPPTYNLITNDDYVSYQGLLWNHKRSSYRADENGEIIYLMGKYVYVYGDVE